MNTEKFRLRLYLALFTTLLVAGVIGFMSLEHLSLVDSIYFAVVTMATVGYGDIHPQTVAGKILAMVLIVGGVGTFLGVVASITDIFVKRREEFFRRQKLNMVAGIYFSELGNGLMARFAKLDPGIGELRQILKISNQWSGEDFQRAAKVLKRHAFTFEARSADLEEMREYLQDRSNLLLRMLENPTLQEHGPFTELLRAVFHLRDELIHRPDLSALPDTDLRHLEGDIIRIYRLLVIEWLAYMHYLKDNYGYLLSLALRVNPFDPTAGPVVRD